MHVLLLRASPRLLSAAASRPPQKRPSRSTGLRRRSRRRSSRATRRAGPRCARCGCRRRCGSTARSTRRSTTCRRSPGSSRWSRRRRARTEKTEVWVAFDDDNVYFSFRCWDSAARAARGDRDAPRRQQFHHGNDIVQVFLDTFYDRRNGLSFTMNSIGARNDGQQVGPSTTPTGTRSGITPSARSTAGGPWRWRSRSGRSATGRARRRSGASTCCGPCAGRTSCRC